MKIFFLKNKNIFLAIFLLALFLLTFFVFEGKNKIEQKMLTNDGAWCWYQDPRAVSYENKTYIGWANQNGDIKIGRYDEKEDNFKSTVLHNSLQKDDHIAPSILKLEDGRLMVFYSEHAGEKSSMYYRISTNPEDIFSWGNEMKLETNTFGKRGYTYSHPVQLSDENNRIYLFWRGGDFKPTFSFSDNKIDWADAKTLFGVEKGRPYLKVFSNNKDKIYFTFTDGHPNEVEFNNVYFAYYQKGSFFKADGTFIKKIADLPLKPEEVDLVYDSSSSKIKGWNWDIAIDDLGNPIIVYSTFPELEDHRYNYAYWDGDNWKNYEITKAGGSIDKDGEPFYSGGIALDHQNPSTIYLSREIDGFHELEKWKTEDQGNSWLSESITIQSSTENIRPVVPRNSGDEGIKVIWMQGDYDHYTEYKTGLKAQFVK